MTLNPTYLALIERINGIEVKFHRDLLAVLSSPFVFSDFFPKPLLFDEDEFSNFEELLEWFKNIESDTFPKDIEKLRLGKYAEELMQFYFQKSIKYTALEHNIQLIDEKLTVGEIDYLLQENKNQNYIHLELAIKFFLKININEEHHWIGPSTKDNLSKKRSKLLNHQLQLTKTYANLIPEKFQRIDFTPKLLLKGAEFIHFKKYVIQANPFKNAWWVHEEDLESIQVINYKFSIVPNRKDWIFPFNYRLEKFNFEELSKEIQDFLLLQNEILVARFDEDENPIDRGFVVQSNWPNH